MVKADVAAWLAQDLLAAAEGVGAEAATAGEGGAGGVNGTADERSDAESAQGDGSPTQVGVCGHSPAGVAELVDIPELPGDVRLILAGMTEGRPPHTPATTPPMLRSRQ